MLLFRQFINLLENLLRSECVILYVFQILYISMIYKIGPSFALGTIRFHIIIYILSWESREHAIVDISPPLHK